MRSMPAMLGVSKDGSGKKIGVEWVNVSFHAFYRPLRSLIAQSTIIRDSDEH
jgi:hypothetical protein